MFTNYNLFQVACTVVHYCNVVPKKRRIVVWGHNFLLDVSDLANLSHVFSCSIRGHHLYTIFSLPANQMDIRLLRKLEITDEQYYARLLALKNFHALVCETVENINDCFGWIFVFSIPFFFVAFITATFFLFGSEGGLKESPLIAAHIIFLFSNCFHFWVVCCASDFIRYQVPVKSYQQIYLCF